MFNSRVLKLYAAPLLDNLKTVSKKAFPASESTRENLLSAQMARKKTFSLSARTLFPSTVRLLFQDPSDRKGTMAARENNFYRSLLGLVSTNVLPQREIVKMAK